MNIFEENIIENTEDIFTQFPGNQGYKELKADKRNPAIRLYGRRFYKDQTPLEYLAEFLMVFVSPKTKSGEGDFSFSVFIDDESELCYWPKDHLALKLFSFFPMSKLETRHPIHREEYLKAIEEIKKKLSESTENKSETIRLVQSLLAGFVGVGKNRTWATYCFLPASPSLLACEVTWFHHDAINEKKEEIKSWEDSKKYFDYTRNFLGRGGELLFLQLANLFFESDEKDDVLEIEIITGFDEYKHIKNQVCSISGLRKKIEFEIKSIIMDSSSKLGVLIDFVESNLVDFNVFSESRKSALGWVPKVTRMESLLFAVEIKNICESHISALEKLDFLQTLCSMQVMRSLCFQGRRIDKSLNKTSGFAGNYVWITSYPSSKPSDPIRKTSQKSLIFVEDMLYRALRSPLLISGGDSFDKKELKNGDDNCYSHFIKLGKNLGFILPQRGSGKRFSIDAKIMRFLVLALLKPDEHIRLTDFYNRVFAHYGIALGGEPLAVALSWCGGGQEKNYAIDMATGWVEETLQQGGFLIELSDAVSIVHNPGSSNRDWS